LFIVKNNWLTENGNLSKTRQFLPETGTEMNSFIIKHSIVLIVIIIEKNSDFPYKYLYFDKSKVLKDKDVLLVLASGFKEKKIRVRKGALYNANLFYIVCGTCFAEATRNGHIAEETLRQATNPNFPGGKDYSKYKSRYELISSEIYNVRAKRASIVNIKLRSLIQILRFFM